MRIGYLLALLSLLPLAAASAGAGNEPPSAELRLAGLKIGDSLARVRKQLGEPERMEGQPGEHHYVLHYPGLRIEMAEPGRVLMLGSTSPRYCTSSGLCPGQPLEQARKRLGEGTLYEGDDSGKLNYDSSDGSCFLAIEPDPSRRLIHGVEFSCP